MKKQYQAKNRKIRKRKVKNFQNQGALFTTNIIGLTVLVGAFGSPAFASYHFGDYSASPPLHVYATTGSAPAGMSPSDIKRIYRLPDSGGNGTIVIISAYKDAGIEKDLKDFSKQFNLPLCSTRNGCFKKHAMPATKKSKKAGSSGAIVPASIQSENWALETALDVEWAHAIAPTAKILLVEAPTPSAANLLAAVDYAAKQKNAVAVSMSWGGDEFPEETKLDAHFTSVSGAQFFASSGDSGNGVSWPAASPNVIAVGGTSVQQTKSSAIKETAWSGSGGGLSAYEAAPDYQTAYGISQSNAMRAVPDVAYDADPASGFPIIHKSVWRTVGGTSAGTPQWAAIAALGTSASNSSFYTDAARSNSSDYFRDITSGLNGGCGYYCKAHVRYDYVTGLGTPQTVTF